MLLDIKDEKGEHGDEGTELPSMDDGDAGDERKESNAVRRESSDCWSPHCGTYNLSMSGLSPSVPQTSVIQRHRRTGNTYHTLRHPQAKQPFQIHQELLDWRFVSPGKPVAPSLWTLEK